MICAQLLALYLALPTAYAAGKLRGVSPDDVEKYQPDADGNWHCLSDPSIVLSFDKVNDDYCDCPDGSDEPGTSACRKSLFYCENIGFRSNFIPSYKVDDGVCDYDVCCDGSDEKPGVCENKCESMRAEYETNVQIHNDKIKRGLQLKSEIIAKSLEIRQELEKSVTQLETEIESTKTEIEVLESERQKMDESQQLIESKFEVITQSLDESTFTLESKFSKLSEYITQLESLELILKHMTKDYNHNFNDPAVKKAARDYLNFAALFNDNSDEESKRVDIGSIINSFKTSIDSLKNDIESSKNEIVKLKSNARGESNEPGFANDLITVISTVCKQMVDSFFGIKSHIIESDEINGQSKQYESPSEIGNKITKLKEHLNSLTNKLKSSESELSKDYGDQDILRSLSDCITTKIGDYDYKIRLSSSLEQINNDNKATKIGVFEKIEYSTLLNNYQIKFERGERCWNGPVREANIDVVCGLTNKILQVTEPEKCMYNLKFQSPIGCFESDLI